MEDSWNYWWSYSGVSGPTYWGLLNLDWFICDKGRRQSPINIETSRLVYDPHLTPLKVDNKVIAGVLYNDGHSVVFNGSLTGIHLNGGRRAPGKLMPSEDGDSDKMHKSATDSIKRRRRESGQRDYDETGSALGLFAPTDTKRLLDHTFQVANRAAAVDPLLSSSSAESLEPSLGDLSKSIQLGVGQTNQLLSSGVVLSSDLATGSDSQLLQVASGATEFIDQHAKEDQEQDQDEQEQTDGQQADGAVPALARVYLSGAGLAYRYQFEAFHLRFGGQDSAFGGGSEHQIDSRPYAGELQLMAYNCHLYKSYLEASTKPNGLLAVSILIDVDPQTTQDDPKSNNRTTTTTRANEQLDKLLVRHLPSLGHRGASALVPGVQLADLLPDTHQFVTYDGSLTQPGCHETVNWLLLNKPLYVSRQNLDRLRSLSADEQSASPTGALLAGNTRPIQPLYGRPIRTNIRPPTQAGVPNNGKSQETCQRLWTSYCTAYERIFIGVNVYDHVGFYI